ncbi:hypothetical protein SLEP1_g50358 [Rubroshorea leprosula]|uniref:DUF4880 domain-containing protein n=1 Tax=Rubroshorea leprosula TaxID=152421 RepID=A0AAV5M2A3_9ROSI|nr:hypothetical protein SLEP1_g50358 [Rubroshorea leprosula]
MALLELSMKYWRAARFPVEERQWCAAWLSENEASIEDLVAERQWHY